ncbi:MAG: hypothetical protein ACXVB9_08575 [Bdellovibrionota bacterium]
MELLAICDTPEMDPGGLCAKSNAQTSQAAPTSPAPADPTPTKATTADPPKDSLAERTPSSSSVPDPFADEKKATDLAVARTKAEEIALEKTQLAADTIARKRLAAAEEAARRKALENALLASKDSTASSPTPNSVIKHDIPIIKTAIDDYENEKPFTYAEADKALIPEVRKNLRDVASAQRLNTNIEKKESALADQLAALLNLGALALQKGQSMESVPTDGSAMVKNPATFQQTKSASNIAVSDFADESTGAKAKAHAATDPNTADSKQIAQMLSEMKGLKNSPLREKLRKRLAAALAEENRKNSALASPTGKDQFSGSLSSEISKATPAAELKNDGSNLAAQVVGSALKESASHFSMNDAETDAAVRQLLKDPGRNPASAADTSILAMDSLSLFARVKIAHEKCERQHCVQAN